MDKEKQENCVVTKLSLKGETWYLNQKIIEIEKEGLTIKEKLQKLQNSYFHK